MGTFRFSRRAEADLLAIGDFTIGKWGKTQAARYIGELETCCQKLADNPTLGRLCDDVRPGLRRHEHGRHILFYRQEPGGILVSRILHQHMLPDRHPLDDQEMTRGGPGSLRGPRRHIRRAMYSVSSWTVWQITGRFLPRLRTG